MVQSQQSHRPALRGVLEAYVSVTAATYTAKGGDRLIGVNRAGVVTVTLPTAQVNKGRSYTIKDESGAAASNNITVATEGSENIDGAATDTISENYGAKTYYSDGSNWFRVPLLAVGSHTLASHSAKAHSDLTAVGAGDHHAQSHALDSHTGTLQHEKGGLEADVNAGDGFVQIKAGSTTVIKSNTAATAAPGATDDSAAGYAVGSIWIDTTNDKAYVCLDATATAAVWTETTQSGGSWGAVTREGGNTTEATTTSTTAVDLLSAAGLTIAATEPFFVIYGARKTSGAAAGAGTGLKLNTTVVQDVNTSNPSGWLASAANEAQDGVCHFFVSSRVTNYVNGNNQGLYSNYDTTPNANSTGVSPASDDKDAALPTAQITDAVIRGATASASQTLGADEFHAYSLAAS